MHPEISKRTATSHSTEILSAWNSLCETVPPIPQKRAPIMTNKNPSQRGRFSN